MNLVCNMSLLPIYLPMPTGTEGPHNSSYADTNSDRADYDVPQTPVFKICKEHFSD